MAARRNISISGLLAAQIETLVGDDDAYELAQRRALALLDQGFHLGAASSRPVTSGTTGKTFVDTNVLIYAHDIYRDRETLGAATDLHPQLVRSEL